MRKPGYILSIDQGTTGSRVILFNHSGEIHSMAYRALRQIYPKPGWVEHDPVEIWNSVRDCMHEALVMGGVGPEELNGIGITNQRESTVLWERDTGKPVYNSICWQCRRSAEICDELKAAGREKSITEKTGLVIDAYFSATKIKWILDNVDGVREQVEKDNICMGTIDSWLIWNLTKGEIHGTDYSNASRTMLLNIHTVEWDQEILEWIGIPRNILPKLFPSSGIIGLTHESIFGRLRIPIAGDAGDQQAAMFGQGCFHPGMVKNTYGTSIAVMMNTGESPFLSRNGLTTDLGWKIGDKVEYSLEGVSFIGGAAIEWLQVGLHLFKDASECSALAEKVSDTGGVYMVPAFTGLCAPYWDMYARGLIIGITRGTTIEHIARSAIESIAYQTRDMIEAMRQDSAVIPSSLRVDGGVTRSSFLLQFQADILGIAVEKPAITEMASLGACYLAGLGVGFWESIEEVEEKWKLREVFEPNMEKTLRDDLYGDWKRAVERTFNWAR
ncbi:MAG: glycerol kinase GlpK [Spirochaetes bacterium]|nr:glycerol kinase GlpK [Spirochaetota bacterium]